MTAYHELKLIYDVQNLEYDGTVYISTKLKSHYSHSDQYRNDTVEHHANFN